MATSFSKIYNLNKLIKNDPRLAVLDQYELNSLCFRYLSLSISYFLYDCRKDLEDKTDPSFSLYNFVGNGSDSSFILSPYPAADSMLVVYYNDVITTNYTYDSTNYTITFNFIPETDKSVVVKTYTIGQFNEDLDIREINILIEGMNVPFLEEMKNDENTMKYIITGKSVRFFSQANHISSTNEAVNNQMYNTVNALISEYTYKGSEDNYKGLGGRGRE